MAYILAIDRQRCFIGLLVSDSGRARTRRVRFDPTIIFVSIDPPPKVVEIRPSDKPGSFTVFAMTGPGDMQVGVKSQSQRYREEAAMTRRKTVYVDRCAASPAVSDSDSRYGVGQG